MREYGKVFSRIWESADFRALSEDGRSLVLYLLTSQHGTIAGVFRVPDGYACEDLQWTSERVAQGFANLSQKGFATRCESTKWVWITKYLEWNPPENPNQRKAAQKQGLSVPDECGWKQAFMRARGESLGIEPAAPKKPLRKGSKRVPEQGTGAVVGTGEGEGTGNKDAPAALLSVVDLVAEGVEQSIASDWLKVRATKKAPLTPTAWEGVKREAALAGLTPAQAVKHAAENTWQGFKAAWINGARVNGHANGHNGYDRTDRRLHTAGLMTGTIRPQAQQETIDVAAITIPS